MKTKETSEMGKCEKCGATQFLSYGTCNYNGVCNGKIIPIETSREQAIAWWNTIPNMSKESMGDKYFSYRDKSKGWYHNLTGREIEEIWKKETQSEEKLDIDAEYEKQIHLIGAVVEYKPNQKQFREFDKELFIAYINKFSEEDRYKATTILFDSLTELDKNVFIAVNKPN